MPWLFRFGATGPLRHTSWSTKRGGVQRCSSCTQCADAFKRCGKTKIQMGIWYCQIAILEAAWFNVDSTSKCLNGRFQLIWLPWLLHEWWHSWRAALLLHFSTVQTCLSKDSANPQHSISARWLKIFSKSKYPTPEKAKKYGFPS